jgi:hypothetical protein
VNLALSAQDCRETVVVSGRAELAGGLPPAIGRAVFELTDHVTQEATGSVIVPLGIGESASESGRQVSLESLTHR